MPADTPDDRSAPTLLGMARTTLRAKHYSPRTKEAYVGWIRRFIRFHKKRHPRTMGEPEVVAFLSSLALDGHVAASTQNQALSALVFLYGEVLGVELDWLQGLVRAKRPERLPVVLTQEEMRRLLSRLSGMVWLAASLMYGAGLRLLACVELRVKDVDLEKREIRVRDVRPCSISDYVDRPNPAEAIEVIPLKPLSAVDFRRRRRGGEAALGCEGAPCLRVTIR